MLPDGVSNPGPLTYESGALLIVLRGPSKSLEQTCQSSKSISMCGAPKAWLVKRAELAVSASIPD